MTLCNAEWRCMLSWKDTSHRSAEKLILRDWDNSELDNWVNIEFMESIWAIWFWPKWVKTQTNKIIPWNDEIFDKKSFLFNC